MKNVSFNILRTGLAATFIWIGVLILLQPEAWGGYLKPWAVNLLPVPIIQALIATALLDIAIGAALLIEPLTWLAALIGVIHVFVVLIVSGITDITVRDIAVLAGSLAVFVETAPKKFIPNNKKI